MIKHLKHAKIKQIIQGIPGGFFSRPIPSKVLLEHEGGCEVVPIRNFESIMLGTECTKMVIATRFYATTTAQEMSDMFSPCDEHL